MIPVNKPYLPEFEKYQRYLQSVYEKSWLTNYGPMVCELKNRLEDYLGVKYLLPVANGTLAMQLAYKVFGLKRDVITTPFTFIATSSSLKWENLEPKFADINPATFNLCPIKVSEKINSETSAIVPVHVYGNPCDVDEFTKLAQSHNLKVIYDAAHAFGIKINNRSILTYGDASTLSFHATKVFHTVEGGAVIFNNADDYERAFRMTNFGIDVDTGEIIDKGINTKMSEVHAAMGLAILDDIEYILEKRVALFNAYKEGLYDYVIFPEWHSQASINGAYFPIQLISKIKAERVYHFLHNHGVMVRKYFYPALNTVHGLSNYSEKCEIAVDYASRTICLPLYFDLEFEQINFIVSLIKQALYKE